MNDRAVVSGAGTKPFRTPTFLLRRVRSLRSRLAPLAWSEGREASLATREKLDQKHPLVRLRKSEALPCSRSLRSRELRLTRGVLVSDRRGRTRARETQSVSREPRSLCSRLVPRRSHRGAHSIRASHRSRGCYASRGAQHRPSPHSLRSFALDPPRNRTAPTPPKPSGARFTRALALHPPGRHRPATAPPPRPRTAGERHVFITAGPRLAYE